MANGKDRNANLELLRILSMVLIVFHHYSYHGGFDFQGVTANKILADLLLFGGKLGVNIFILITGYFTVHSSFKWRKLIRVWLAVVFWSVFGVLLGALLVKVWPTAAAALEMELSLGLLLKSFLPISFNAYWFATDYLVLYLISPFLSWFVKNAGEKQSKRLVLILLVIWCIIPTFLVNREGWAYSDLGWFILMYLTGAHLSLYGKKYIQKSAKCILLGSLTVAVVWTIAVLADVSGMKFSSVLRFSTYFMNMTSVFMYFGSVFLFLGFAGMEISRTFQRAVNLIASGAFGVYLFHENEYVRPFLWQVIFRNSEYAQSSVLLFLGHAVCAVMLVYIAGTALELLRQYVVEKPVMKLVDKVSDYAKSKGSFWQTE